MFYIIDKKGNYHGEFQKYAKAEAALHDILADRPELADLELEISVPDAEDVAERIRNADEWDPDDCRELCDLAGLSDEWANADGNTFEQVIYKAAEILGVEVI